MEARGCDKKSSLSDHKSASQTRASLAASKILKLVCAFLRSNDSTKFILKTRYQLPSQP